MLPLDLFTDRITLCCEKPPRAVLVLEWELRRMKSLSISFGKFHMHDLNGGATDRVRRKRSVQRPEAVLLLESHSVQRSL